MMEDKENCIVWSFIICTLHQTIRVIKSWRMRWAGNTARKGEMRHSYKILFEKN
jgi:hypothetical protein